MQSQREKDVTTRNLPTHLKINTRTFCNKGRRMVWDYNDITTFLDKKNFELDLIFTDFCMKKHDLSLNFMRSFCLNEDQSYGCCLILK